MKPVIYMRDGMQRQEAGETERAKNFFPIYSQITDIPPGSDGRWRLVELNDGCMSGLSCIDPGYFYGALAMELR